MVITIPAKPFNAMVKSMKQVIQPSSVRPMARRIHLRAFESAPGTWYFRASASDGFRVAEHTVEPLSVDCATGPATASIDPPRLAAKGPVRVEMLEDRTVVSFDDVAFTTMAGKPAEQVELDAAPANNPIEAFSAEAKTGLAARPGRLSVCCNPKYLLAAVDAMKGAQRVRIDVGSPVAPILLTAGDDDGASMFHMVLPVRTRMDDAEYRAGLAKTVIPAHGKGGTT